MSEISLSAGEWVAIAVGFIIVIGGGLQMPKYWRGELRDLHDQGSSILRPFGEPIRRGFLRTLHLGLVSVASALLVLVFSYIEATSTRPPVAAAAKTAEGAFVALFLLTLVLDLFVILVNKPKALVPPPYRNDRGAIGQWIEQRRKRKEAKTNLS